MGKREDSVNSSMRRDFLKMAGSGAVAATLGNQLFSGSATASNAPTAKRSSARKAAGATAP
jgi:hypothetical protein